MTIDRWQYLLVLAGCLLITLPLEFLGTGVYRRPGRTLRAILPVAAVFVVWDVIAVHAGVWHFDPRRILGVEPIGGLPLEELLFFLVVPLCGLLTLEAVDGLLGRMRRERARR